MVFPILILSLLVENNVVFAKDKFDYCLPYNNGCWPNQTQWNNLRLSLSVGGKLHYIGNTFHYLKACPWNITDPYTLANEGEGRCMQYHECSKKKCKYGGLPNIPEYSIEASVEKDIIKGIKFANQHNIQVVVKTSGHNYAGSSMGYGTLLIWMRHFKKYGKIKENYEKCGKTYDAVLKIGGGQIWDEAYRAAGTKYDLIGGGCLTVSAAGGWLNGGGLSAISRLYGLGIDQVVEFEIITASGSKVKANECENNDLFWALRGGGGGTFGVTTSVHYRMHAAKPFCEISFAALDKETVDNWIDFFVDNAPTLDLKYNGYFSLNSALIYYQGTESEAQSDPFFVEEIPNLGNITWTQFRCAESYIAARGYPDNWGTLPTGNWKMHVKNRLIPIDFMQHNPEETKDILKWIAWVAGDWYTQSYFLGGQVNAVGEDETAVNPAMRRSLLQIMPINEDAIQKVRDEFPDSGVGVNHADSNEPDWEHQFWGSNLERLQTLKKKWDPENRFNCWHCVGYLSKETLKDKVENKLKDKINKWKDLEPF